MAVTAVACTYQWAETTRIARGRGTDWPNACHASVYRFFSSAFIGFPWPKNAAGMTVMWPLPTRHRDHRPRDRRVRGHAGSAHGRSPAQGRGQPAGSGALTSGQVTGIGQRAL